MPESAEPTAKDYRVYRLESDLAKAIRVRLQSLGAVVVKIHGDAFQQRAVDFLCCYRGRFIAIEAKVGTNQPTKQQSLFLQQVRDAGGIGIAAWTVADCLTSMQEIDKEIDNKSKRDTPQC